MDSYEMKKSVLFRIGISLLALVIAGFTFVLIFYIATQQMSTMIFALLIGGAGACVSFFLRFPRMGKSELEFIVSSWWAIIVPVLVGLVMGGFIYIVFFAGTLTGDGGKGLFTSNLFPLFTDPSVIPGQPLDLKTALEIRPQSVQDFGKLLAWCFLAGYSERLVPSILESLEQRGLSGNGKED
jgi:hypothetical protein